MKRQQILEELQNRSKDLMIQDIQPINDSPWHVITVGWMKGFNIQIYLLEDNDVLPNKATLPYKIPSIIFDGEHACLYAYYYSNMMWFCNQLIWRKMDFSFIGKILSLGSTQVDKKSLYTIVAKKADMPHVIINYLRDYSLAQPITGNPNNDILDRCIIKALTEQQFQIIHTETKSLNVPTERMSILMNYLFGAYKRGWYNIAILPQEEMQKSTPNITFVNQYMGNIFMELFYYPQYAYDVEILPYPMTWTTQVPIADIQKIKDLCASTYSMLSNEI